MAEFANEFHRDYELTHGLPPVGGWGSRDVARPAVGPFGGAIGVRSREMMTPERSLRRWQRPRRCPDLLRVSRPAMFTIHRRGSQIGPSKSEVAGSNPAGRATFLSSVCHRCDTPSSILTSRDGFQRPPLPADFQSLPQFLV